jgi:hypothetical protein
MIRFILFLCLALPAHAASDWATSAHDLLIERAFPAASQECLTQIKAGSAFVDRLENQTPSNAYQHALRQKSEKKEFARSKMATFIQYHYELAALENRQALLATHNTEAILHHLRACFERGVGLHPLMDSTSPAHADFAIWSLTDIDGWLSTLQHGDSPLSIETEAALIRAPDLLTKTIGLMRLWDKLYLELGWLDLRFE